MRRRARRRELRLRQMSNACDAFYRPRGREAEGPRGRGAEGPRGRGAEARRGRARAGNSTTCYRSALMLEIVLEEPGRFVTKDAPEPRPAPGEALVRVHRIGVCGTDLHAFGGRQPFFTYPR